MVLYHMWPGRTTTQARVGRLHVLLITLSRYTTESPRAGAGYRGIPLAKLVAPYSRLRDGGAESV